MTAQTSDVSISSAALLTIGGDDINSFGDASREAKICGVQYPIILEDIITRHPWRFTMGQKQLSQLVDTPLFGYQYAYQLPSDMVSLNNMELPGEYQVFEDKLYSDLSEMKITYQFRPKESTFPPYFVRLLVLEMAALLAVALKEDKELMQLYHSLAEKQEAKARNTDSKIQPSRGVREAEFVLNQVRCM